MSPANRNSHLPRPRRRRGSCWRLRTSVLPSSCALSQKLLENYDRFLPAQHFSHFPFPPPLSAGLNNIIVELLDLSLAPTSHKNSPRDRVLRRRDLSSLSHLDERPQIVWESFLSLFSGIAPPSPLTLQNASPVKEDWTKSGRIADRSEFLGFP